MPVKVTKLSNTSRLVAEQKFFKILARMTKGRKAKKDVRDLSKGISELVPDAVDIEALGRDQESIRAKFPHAKSLQAVGNWVITQPESNEKKEII